MVGNFVLRRRVSNVKLLRQPIASNVTYDIGTPTVYLRIYKRKFLTLSNQTSRYIRKSIRISLIIYVMINFSFSLQLSERHFIGLSKTLNFILILV